MEQNEPTPLNPFPGLRPFQTDEDHLFFGREAQTAALLALLREHLEAQAVLRHLPGRIESVTADGSLATLSRGRHVRVLDLESGRFVGEGIDNASFGELDGACFHPGGKIFVSFGLEGIKFRSSTTGEIFSYLRDAGPAALSFSPDGRQFVTSEPQRGVVRLWDATPLLERSAPPVVVETFDSDHRFARFDPTGERLALVEWRPGSDPEPAERWFSRFPALWPPERLQLRVIDRASGETISSHSFDGHANTVSFLPDGGAIALTDDVSLDGKTGHGSNPASLRIIDLTGGKSTRFEVHDPVVSLAISPDGRWLGLACRASARLIDRNSGGTITLPTTKVSSFSTLAFSPDGSLVAFGGAGSGFIGLYDTAAAGEIAWIPAHADALTSLEFSPDGRLLLSASADGSVKLWETIRRETTFVTPNRELPPLVQ